MTFADRMQLRRWQTLLTVPPEHVLPDGPRVQEDLKATRGRPRPWLVACLGAIDARRQGVDVHFGAELAPVPGRRPAAEGEIVCEAVWTAYLLHTLGRPEGGAWLSAMIDTLAPTALVFGLEDNPEPWWRAEMVILHALHSFALQSRDGRLIDRTLACADFHLREIQPDHATNEPWAVHAYASHHDGNVTAETLWHAAHIQHGGQLGPVSVLLARDAAAALTAWLAA